MTLDDLARTLADVVAAGRIGTLVSLRVSLHCPPAFSPPERTAWRLLEALGVTDWLRDGRVRALGRRPDAQLSVLCEAADGRTVSVTVARGPVDPPRVQLTAIGNHGLARLEESDVDWPPNESPTAAETATIEAWSRAVRDSLAEDAAIPFGATGDTDDSPSSADSARGRRA